MTTKVGDRFFRAELYHHSQPVELDEATGRFATRAEAQADGEDCLAQCDSHERSEITIVVREFEVDIMDGDEIGAASTV